MPSRYLLSEFKWITKNFLAFSLIFKRSSMISDTLAYAWHLGQLCDPLPNAKAIKHSFMQQQKRLARSHSHLERAMESGNFGDLVLHHFVLIFVTLFELVEGGNNGGLSFSDQIHSANPMSWEPWCFKRETWRGKKCVFVKCISSHFLQLVYNNQMHIRKGYFIFYYKVYYYSYIVANYYFCIFLTMIFSSAELLLNEN